MLGPPYIGDVDQSIKDTQNKPNQLHRRMENYMIAGTKHMLENPPHIDGVSNPISVRAHDEIAGGFPMKILIVRCRSQLYLDGASYDRYTMRRLRKVLDTARPGGEGLLDLHGANSFDIPQIDCCHAGDPAKHVPSCQALGAVCKGSWSGGTSSALRFMDLMPYLDSTMFGEWFSYGTNYGHPGEDYWLVEISAIRKYF